MKYSRRVQGILSIAVVAASILSPSRTSANPSRSARIVSGAPPNLLFIMIDEASMWSMVTPDGRINARRFPGFASLARNSTWYRDAMSTAQWTWFAAPSLLTGLEATFAKLPKYSEWPNNIFTALKDSLPMDVQEPVTSLCPASVCARPMQSSKTMTPKDHVLRLYETVGRAANDTAPGFHFVHALIPHRPWLLTPEMRMSANEEPDPRGNSDIERKRDVYQGHLRQYAALDVAIGDMVKTMKSSPMWDDTMIIVTADHGLTLRPGMSVRDDVNPRNIQATDEIFRVPLFIKYPRQKSGRISDCAVSSMDIVPTILSVAGVRTSWSFDGVDLTTKCPRRTIRPIHWPGGVATTNSHLATLLASVNYYDAWVDAEGTVDDIARVGLSGRLVGTAVPKSAPLDSRVEWTLDRPRDFAKVGKGRFASAPGRATGKFRTNEDIGSRTEGLLVVDGTVLGVLGEIANSKKSESWRFFSSCLMTSALTQGAHTVELWTAQWTGSTPTLRHVSTPKR